MEQAHDDIDHKKLLAGQSIGESSHVIVIYTYVFKYPIILQQIFMAHNDHVQVLLDGTSITDYDTLLNEKISRK